MRGRFAIAAILVVAVSSPPGAQSPPKAGSGSTKAAPAAPKPWPDAKTLEARRRDAEGRRLFSTHEPLAFTLAADFKAIGKDRNPNSTKTYAATIEVASQDGTTASIPVQIRTRGHVRRRPDICSFAPLRVEFTKGGTKGTVFTGQSAIKLGTHCQDGSSFDQYVIREYSVYRLYNLITPRSFRARLAKATYQDSVTKKSLGTHSALWIEDDEDVAKRLGGRIVDVTGITFRRVDQEAVAIMMLFEYMIGNTDLSMISPHNVRFVQTPAGKRYPVPYDFDYSGLVDAGYAVPAKGLGIEKVRDRLYRGPCMTVEELQPHLDRLRGLKPEVMALYDTLPDLTASSRKNITGYLEEFYRTIDRPADVKRDLVAKCEKIGI
jgi:hypothetical protein